jgi:hypothetical protein
MTERSAHARAVDAWVAHVSRDGPGTDLLARFEAAFDALWNRARVTLGEITLAAVTRRVLADAVEAFPAFESVLVDENGLHCDAARAELRALDDAVFTEAARLVLATWLSVLGNLTADILTPSLHAALAAATDSHAVHVTRDRKDRPS